MGEGGCNTPILYWENDPDGKHPIIDGMTRHRICLDNELDFPTKGMQFTDRHEVIRWIRRNQAGRRNLSVVQRAMIIADIVRKRLMNRLSCRSPANRGLWQRNPKKMGKRRYCNRCSNPNRR